MRLLLVLLGLVLLANAQSDELSVSEEESPEQDVAFYGRYLSRNIRARLEAWLNRRKTETEAEISSEESPEDELARARRPAVPDKNINTLDQLCGGKGCDRFAKFKGRFANLQAICVEKCAGWRPSPPVTRGRGRTEDEDELSVSEEESPEQDVAFYGRFLSRNIRAQLKAWLDRRKTENEEELSSEESPEDEEEVAWWSRRFRRRFVNAWRRRIARWRKKYRKTEEELSAEESPEDEEELSAAENEMALAWGSFFKRVVRRVRRNVRKARKHVGRFGRGLMARIRAIMRRLRKKYKKKGLEMSVGDEEEMVSFWRRMVRRVVRRVRKHGRRYRKHARKYVRRYRKRARKYRRFGRFRRFWG